MSDCIFCKIINGDFGTEFVYENESAVVFKDINPKADTHLLLVLKAQLPFRFSAKPLYVMFYCSFNVNFTNIIHMPSTVPGMQDQTLTDI